ncbi:DUF2069 domain-containing protein [Oleiagrimonas sp. C23AA]|uniref:DUF2069 domain-containing protein n=1 Tax=Oleiagrimonas sp. C23AA TaxID=2719047 RepID=UPI00142058DF|nr:DUF2069 domain-containing protein [Oleiagrimonas sp. C23AA]NII11579.1 DUF2069 domain-containing protein [Oleiagrimonas sp. C23AA]
MSATPRQRRALTLGLIAWAALAVLQPLWHGWLAPPDKAVFGIVVLATVPLLLPALALRQPRRALLIAGMLALFYFCHGIADAWSAPQVRALALTEVLLCLGLIFALGAGVQRRSRG